MATLTRYEPWGILNQLRRELDQAGKGAASDGSVATAEWVPAVDIKEDSDEFLLEADIPGVKPEQIDVSMEDGVLTVKGEKETEAKSEDNGYRRVERVYGSFYRRFSLPDTADSEAISAKINDGVLRISIPKREAVKPKKIEVAVA